MHRFARTVPVACSFVCAMASSTFAGTMLQPSAASTNMGNFGTYEPIRAINQSGMSAAYVSGVTDFNTFVPSTTTSNGGNSFNAWFSNLALTGNFDFALGGSFTIDALALWADPQGIGQGVKNFTLLADDNAAFSSPTVLGNYVANDGVNFNQNAVNFGQTFSFSPTTATHVRMQITSNHGSSLTTGFSEAAFSVVPEPATLGSLAIGSVLLISRRRKG